MSHFLFFWLLFVLGNLLKNANRFVGHLTLLKESDELEQVRRHHLVCICEFELMRLGLRAKKICSLFSCRGYFHSLTMVPTIKKADELY
jgi:hypothetical protein